MTGQLGPTGVGLYRAGAIASFAFFMGYLTIIALYATVGVPPSNGEAWMNYAPGRTTAWWGIVGLSILTDILLVPIALSLYSALKGVSKIGILLAVAFVGSFVVLDLAVTWPYYSSLLILSGNYASAANDAQRAVYLAAANNATSMLTSPAEAVLSILTLSVGIFIAGLVMLKGKFAGATAYLALATGVLGIVSTAGSILGDALASTIIVTSLLTMIWILFLGYRLNRLSAAGPSGGRPR